VEDSVHFPQQQRVAAATTLRNLFFRATIPSEVNHRKHGRYPRNDNFNLQEVFNFWDSQKSSQQADTPSNSPPQQDPPYYFPGIISINRHHTVSVKPPAVDY
jgi:hypothetical protein